MLPTQAINISELQGRIDPAQVGRDMYGLVEELYPICRSITGEGFRQTMNRLRQEIPLAVHEVPTGTAVFDWTVPKEWNIRDAWVKKVRASTFRAVCRRL